MVALAGLVGGCAQAGWMGHSFGPSADQEPSAVRRAAAFGPDARHVAEFDRAVALTAELRYKEAAEEFERLVPVFEDAEDHKHATESMFWLGYCYEKQGMKAEAAALYGRLAAEQGRAPAGVRAAERLRALRAAEAKP